VFDLIGAQGMNVELRKFIVFNLKKEKNFAMERKKIGRIYHQEDAKLFVPCTSFNILLKLQQKKSRKTFITLLILLLFLMNFMHIDW